MLTLLIIGIAICVVLIGILLPVLKSLERRDREQQYLRRSVLEAYAKRLAREIEQ